MPVLVLNASLQPLSVIPERRLVVLLSKQKVTFVDEAVRQLIEEGIAARQLQSEEPVIVQLLANVRVPRMVLRPTRANILLRDEETCQYCGKHSRELTLAAKAIAISKTSVCTYCGSRSPSITSTPASSCSATRGCARRTSPSCSPRRPRALRRRTQQRSGAHRVPRTVRGARHPMRQPIGGWYLSCISLRAE